MKDVWDRGALGFLRLVVTVGVFDNLQGMQHPVRSQLIKLEPAADAIRGDYFGIDPL